MYLLNWYVYFDVCVCECICICMYIYIYIYVMYIYNIYTNTYNIIHIYQVIMKASNLKERFNLIAPRSPSNLHPWDFDNSRDKKVSSPYWAVATKAKTKNGQKSTYRKTPVDELPRTGTKERRTIKDLTLMERNHIINRYVIIVS
jgi:hypothetical protein